MELRDYQIQAYQDTLRALREHRADLLVMPTGGGKTQVFVEVIANWPGPTVLIAHRKELIQQASLTLAARGITHRIVAPKDVQRRIRAKHRERFGRTFYDANARDAVASVDTMCTPRALREFSSFYKTVGLVVFDEAHHVLEQNKWGTAARLFPDAKILGVTATPERADGLGLGVSSAGIFNHMTITVSEEWLIENGWLCPFIILRPPTDFRREGIPVSKAGRLNEAEVVRRIKKSCVLGDAVEQYLKHTPGARGVNFAPSIEIAHETAARFNAAGVPAIAVDGNTHADIRDDAVDRLSSGKILMLCNVGLFGEGFDLPEIEVVSDCAPTESLSAYRQRVGRMLRTAKGKKFATYLDHVSNSYRHGRPDLPRVWSLDGRSSIPGDDGTIPQRICVSCTRPYGRVSVLCPYCGWAPPPPTSRSGPEFVDGDLTEMEPGALDALRADADKSDESPYLRVLQATGSAGIAQHQHTKHLERCAVQTELRSQMAQWAASQTLESKYSDREIRKLFYFKFGVDVISARAYTHKKAEELCTKILTDGPQSTASLSKH